MPRFACHLCKDVRNKPMENNMHHYSQAASRGQGDSWEELEPKPRITSPLSPAPVEV